MALDGTHPVELALEVDGEKVHPDWSPDGARIVFDQQTVQYALDPQEGRRRGICS